MAMLEVLCKDCKQEFSLRGWIEKEDLKGSPYEYMMDTITEEELSKLQEEGKVKDPWDKFDDKCPACGSKNVISF